MLRHKRALLVSPSYATLGLDSKTRHVLENAGVLPRDLGKYNTEVFECDAAVLRHQLGSGFSWDTLEGEVLSSTLLDRLRWLLSRDTEVAVLLFCGHGMWQGAQQHGSMVCSFKQLVTAEAIESVVADTKFNGTFVRLLNMCDDAVSTALRREPEGAPPISVGLQGTCNYYGITVAATQQFGQIIQVDKNSGSELGVALGRMFNQEVLVTYEGFERALAKQWSGAQVRMTHAFRGVFGTPAISVSPTVNHKDDADSVSDTEIVWGGLYS